MAKRDEKETATRSDSAGSSESMREINTDLPVSEAMGFPSELTPVEERRQWLQDAFSKKPSDNSNETKFRSPTPREGFVHDRVLWLKGEAEKYSKSVMPENVTRKRFSDGGATDSIRTDPAETRNDLDEDVQIRRAKADVPGRHSFPTGTTVPSQNQTTELQIRDEPQNFLFPVVRNEIEVPTEDFLEEDVAAGLQSPPTHKTSKNVHPVSVESDDSKMRKDNNDDVNFSEDARLQQLIPFSDSPYYRKYEHDRVCTLSPASANSLPDYAHLNSGVMAKGQVEGIVCDAASTSSQKRLQVREWRHRKAERFGDDDFNSDYISFHSPMGNQGGASQSMIAKRQQLEPHVVENQCFDSCGCSIL